jgi:hypothetical protein
MSASPSIYNLFIQTDDVTQRYFAHDYLSFLYLSVSRYTVKDPKCHTLVLILFEDVISNISALTMYRISQHTGSVF